MNNEKVSFKIVGRWFDKLIYPDGREEFGEHGEFDWGYNQIQNTCAIFLAGRMKGDPAIDFMDWFAVGSGDPSWDTTPPTKSYDQAALTNESFRKAILTTEIVYLDPDTDLVSVTPTRKIEVTVVLLPGEATGTLREFGLFGGTATAATDSGEMVNWISHSRIDKDAALQIQRKVRIEFQIQ